jgi:hypothetical protein
MNTQPLFNYIHQEFGVSALETDMQEIINIVNLMTIQEELNYLSERLNRIEEQLATNHNSVADAIRPTEPDYTHLLPEGYEFCAEQDAEKWVKVKYESGWVLGAIVDKSDSMRMTVIMSESIKPYYRPIRQIKYHVAVHEVVTAEPDPYQPDWTKAPEGTVAHAYDESKLGYWYTIIFNNSDTIFKQMSERSNLRLPSGLDWKQSLRVNPKLK